MAQKAYLLQLSGMGDQQWKLLDQTAYDYFSAVDSRRPGTPMPSIPEALRADVDAYCAQQRAQDDEYDCVTDDILTVYADSSTIGNDLALTIPGSDFNGERFDTYNPSIADLNAFVARHGLDLVEAYHGSIY